MKSRKKDKPDPGMVGRVGLAILYWLGDCLYKSQADCMELLERWDV